MFPKLFTQSILFVLLQWLVIKLVLSSTGMTGLGYYFFYLSLVAPIFVLVSSHFKNYGTQDADIRKVGRVGWPELVRLRDQQVFALLVVIVLGAFVVLSTIETGAWKPLESNITMLLMFLFVCALKLFEVMSDTRQALEIRSQSIGLGLFVTLIVFLITLAVFILVSLQRLSLNWLTISVGGIVVFVSALVYMRASIGQPVSVKGDNRLILYFIKQVGLQAFIISLIAAVPRITVELMLGPEDLAVFGSLIYFYLLAHIFTTSLFQSRIHIQKDNSRLITPLLVLLGVGFGAIGFSLVFHYWIIALVFDTSVAQHSWRLPYFVGFITIGALVTYLEQFYILRHQSDRLIRINTMTLLVASFACPWLVSQWKFDGVVAYMYLLFIGKFLWLWSGVPKDSESPKEHSQTEGKLSG